MANAAGLVQESIWRDEDWRELSRGAQALYVQLLSQKDLDCAGLLPLQPDKWATGCNSLTVDQVWTDLEELQRKLFVFFDTDTYEAFVRTHIRNSNVMKVPNMLKSARRSAVMVASELIRPILAAELRATGNAECAAVADQIDPNGTLSKPFQNPSRTLSDSNPFETLPEGSGVGTGMGTGVTLVSTHLREAPPSEFCAEHPNGTERKCFACGQARRSYPRRKAEWDDANKQALKAIRENCPRCEGTNTYEDDDGVHPCNPHLEANHA